MPNLARPLRSAGRPRADDWRPAFYEPSLPGRGPIAGQQVTQSRVAPPPGSRSRHRIDRCAYLMPEPIHPVSPVYGPTCIHGPPLMTRKRTGANDRPA
jgi:hypothetical protein